MSNCSKRWTEVCLRCCRRRHWGRALTETCFASIAKCSQYGKRPCPRCTSSSYLPLQILCRYAFNVRHYIRSHNWTPYFDQQSEKAPRPQKTRTYILARSYTYLCTTASSHETPTEHASQYEYAPNFKVNSSHMPANSRMHTRHLLTGADERRVSSFPVTGSFATLQVVCWCVRGLSRHGHRLDNHSLSQRARCAIFGVGPLFRGRILLERAEGVHYCLFTKKD